MQSWRFSESDTIVPGRHAVALLGGGTRYEAWLAWDDRLHALVVAKLLRPGLTDSPVALGGLRAEAELLSELAHPMLLRSFGVVPDGPRPHLVLEHLEGPRLSTLIRRYGLSLEQLLPLGLNLASALHYLAAEDVVHLDVKPRNVIMAGSPRLIDLSVAQRLERVAHLAEPTGTAAYMAPEQCDPGRFGEIGPPADVWGLGATLLEGLTRERPFGPALDGRYLQLEQRPPAPPADAPRDLAALIEACLEHRPADRPTAAAVADALEPMAAGLPAPRLGRFRPTPHQRPTYEEALP